MNQVPQTELSKVYNPDEESNSSQLGLLQNSIDSINNYAQLPEEHEIKYAEELSQARLKIINMSRKLNILYDNLVLERAVKIEGYPVTKVIDVSQAIYYYQIMLDVLTHS